MERQICKLLSNLKCRTLGDFEWYKNAFFSRIYSLSNNNYPFWKEKYLTSLPRSLGGKVKDKKKESIQ